MKFVDIICDFHKIINFGNFWALANKDQLGDDLIWHVYSLNMILYPSNNVSWMRLILVLCDDVFANFYDNKFVPPLIMFSQVSNESSGIS